MSAKPDYIESLEKDIRFFRDAMKEAAETLIQDDITRFPIFIAYQGEYFPIGENILPRQEYNAVWSVNATSAETLINEGIIAIDKAKYFLTQYKPADQFMCLFVVKDEQEAQFIFMPYNS